MKHIPSDHPPVLLWYSVHTCALLACFFGITARTITVVIRPHIDKVNAIRLINGINRFPRQTIAQHDQLTIWNTMNTCHGCHCIPRWPSKNIATASLPSIELIDEQDRSHAQAFRYPVKNPAFRPRSRLSTEAQ